MPLRLQFVCNLCNQNAGVIHFNTTDEQEPGEFKLRVPQGWFMGYRSQLLIDDPQQQMPEGELIILCNNCKTLAKYMDAAWADVKSPCLACNDALPPGFACPACGKK